MNSIVNLKEGLITFNSTIDHSLSFSKCAIGYSNYSINSHERGALVFLTNNNANTTNISMPSDIRMCIASDGNVGIGTINPAQRLHIVHTNNNLIRIETDTNGTSQTSGIEFGVPAFATATRSKITSTTSTGDASDLQFYTANAANGSTLRLSITSTGTISTNNNNIGVGTGTVTAASFVGALTGNAATATTASGLTGNPNISVGTITTNNNNIGVGTGTVTAASFVGALTGNAATATTASGLTGNPNISVGTITTNNNNIGVGTGTVTAASFIGALTGNAATATTATTATYLSNAANITTGTINSDRLPLATSAGAVGAVKKGNNINIAGDGTISVDLASYTGNSTINGDLEVNSNLIVHGTSTTLNTDVYTTERLDLTYNGTTNSTLTIKQTAVGNTNNILNVTNSSSTNVFNISSSGNVIIGSTINSSDDGNPAYTIPDSIFYVKAPNVSQGTANITFRGGNVGTNDGKVRIWLASDASHASYIENTHTTGGNTVLTFGTSSGNVLPSERMRIGNTGDVGIGTNSPTARLHLHNTTANSDVSIRFSDGTSGATTNDGFSIGEDSNQRAYLWNNEETDMAFATHKIERLTIKNDGNIGIGTNSTIQSKLTINPIVIDRNTFSHSEAPLTITNSTPTATSVLNDPRAVLHLCRQGTNSQAHGARASFKLCRYENISTNSRTRLDITLAQNSYDDINAMTILGNGNVGIGTTNPVGRLHIVHTNNNLIRIETDTNAVSQTSGIEFGIPEFATATRSKITSTTYTGAASDLQFYTANAANGSTLRLSITSTGTISTNNNNIGVGTGTVTAASFVGALTGNAATATTASGLTGNPNISVGTITTNNNNIGVGTGTVTAASFVGALTGNAATATTASGLTGNPNISVGTITTNNNNIGVGTGTVTAASFVGALTGNAATATTASGLTGNPNISVGTITTNNNNISVGSGTVTAASFVGALTGNAATATTASGLTGNPNISVGTITTNNNNIGVGTGTVTAASFIGALTGNAATATTASGLTGNPNISVGTITTNNNNIGVGTGTVTAGTFIGALTGNAATATTATTATYLSNAANITTGTINSDRLPVASVSVLGGLKVDGIITTTSNNTLKLVEATSKQQVIDENPVIQEFPPIGRNFLNWVGGQYVTYSGQEFTVSGQGYGNGIYTVYYVGPSGTTSSPPSNLWYDNSWATWSDGYNSSTGIYNRNPPLSVVGDSSYYGDGVSIKFPNFIKITSYKIKATVNTWKGPKDFKIYGSKDSITWVSLDVKENISYDANRYYEASIITTEFYNHFALTVKKIGNGSTALQMDEWRIYGNQVNTYNYKSNSIIKYVAGNQSDTTLRNTGSWQIVDDISISTADYYTKTQIDTNNYTKTQIDTNNYTKTQIDTNIYTKTQIDAKGYLTTIPAEYITETELATNNYTKTQIDTNIYTKTQIDTNIYTKTQIDAKGYLTTIPAEYITETELATNNYTKTQSDTNYYTKTQIDTNNYTKTQVQALAGTNMTWNTGTSKFDVSITSQWTTSGTNIYNANTGNVGIGTNNPATYKCQVFGDIGASGNVIAYYSDERLKNITEYIDNVLPILDKINVFKYNCNDLAESFGYDKSKKEIGLSAQEIQKYYPEIVSIAPFDADYDEETKQIISKSGENYLTLDYQRLVPVLLQAIKELNHKYTALEDKYNKIMPK
jgi:hypothetical protein